MINSLNIAGRLTDNAKKAGNEDMPILNFSIAFDTFKKGEKQANFIDCTIFGNRARALAEILKKGNLVFLNGNLEQQVWEKEGKTYSKLAMIVHDVTLASKKNDDVPF